MITILVETAEEYDYIMETAHRYVCLRLPFDVCNKYECYECYKDNDVKCGIRVIRVDNEKPNLL